MKKKIKIFLLRVLRVAKYVEEEAWGSIEFFKSWNPANYDRLSSEIVLCKHYCTDEHDKEHQSLNNLNESVACTQGTER